MTIDTGALSTSTDAIVALTGVLGVKIFVVLAVTMGLGVGIWFLSKTFRKAKGGASGKGS